MPPDQKESQTRSILLLSSPVITGFTLVTAGPVGVDMGNLLPTGPPGQPCRMSEASDSGAESRHRIAGNPIWAGSRGL